MPQAQTAIRPSLTLKTSSLLLLLLMLLGIVAALFVPGAIGSGPIGGRISTGGTEGGWGKWLLNSIVIRVPILAVPGLDRILLLLLLLLQQLLRLLGRLLIVRSSRGTIISLRGKGGAIGKVSIRGELGAGKKKAIRYENSQKGEAK